MKLFNINAIEALAIAASYVAAAAAAAAYNTSYSYSCTDFMHSLEHLHNAAGLSTIHLRAHNDDNNAICKQLMSAMMMGDSSGNNVVPAIINLGKFFESSSSSSASIRKGDIVPDYHHTHRALQADPIEMCLDPADDECPHAPCIAEYLAGDSDPETNRTYDKFSPSYGIGPVAEDVLLPVGTLWSGNVEDRPESNEVGALLTSTLVALAAATANDYVCEPIEDSTCNKCNTPVYCPIS